LKRKAWISWLLAEKSPRGFLMNPIGKEIGEKKVAHNKLTSFCWPSRKRKRLVPLNPATI